jgi:hypothetical protein
MPTNVTQKDKTLQEVIDWCTARANELTEDMEGDYEAKLYKVAELLRVIDHCESMLGYGGTMPAEVPNQSEDAK